MTILVVFLGNLEVEEKSEVGPYPRRKSSRSSDCTFRFLPPEWFPVCLLFSNGLRSILAIN